MERMINANMVIASLEAKIKFRKNLCKYALEEDMKEHMAIITAYENVVEVIKAGVKNGWME